MKNKLHVQFIKRIGRDPFTDWGLILTLSLVVTIIFTGFSFKLFLATNVVTPVPVITLPKSSQTDRTLNVTGLSSVIGLFQAKNAQAPQYISSYPGPTDPSYPVGYSLSSPTKPAKTLGK